MIKPRIGISIGDLNGIGLEVILKTILPKGIADFCTPVIYANSKTVAYHRNALEMPTFEFQSLVANAQNLNQDMINIVNCWDEAVEIQFGKVNETGGKYALKSLEAATNDLIAGHIDALVTAPIHKQAMQMAGFKHVGHTEYLTEKMGASQQVMLLCEDTLRVGLVTNHLPVGEIAAAITSELVLEKIKILHASLRKDFGIDKPKIAVLGLNPHAGDGGVLGTEEATQILPAIEVAKAARILAFGPYPADGFFGSGNYKNFDAILAMYHDQGLAPFKALSFGKGVNYTAGLDRIRTSPDHGTGHDIAGKDQADENSFRQALFMAIDIVRERAGYDERYGNPLKRHELTRERY